MDDQGKRLLLAFAISFALIVAYQAFFTPSTRQPSDTTVEKTADTEEKTTADPAAALAPEELPALTGSVEPIAAAAEQTVTVESPLYTAVLTNRGAALKSFTLNEYRQNLDEDESRVQMVRTYSEGERLPLTAEFSGAGGPLGFADALFTTGEDRLVLAEGQEATVTFTHRNREGLHLTKTLLFKADRYEIECDLRLANLTAGSVGGRLFLEWPSGLEPPTDRKEGRGLSPSRYGYQGAVIMNGADTTKIKGKKLEGTAVYDYTPRWIASEDMYFAASLSPQAGVDGAVARKVDDGRVAIALFAQVDLDAGTGRRMTSSAYVGPKEIDSLQKADESLVRLIDLGIFGFIAKPLLLALNFFYKYLGNYGLAIIILSALIKIVFIPFSTISHRSMKKMQQLQPQINALRDRYKKDRDKLNAEIMKLYSENKVNPAGGCLPILVQIPVFFALYRALLGAIELRHAPFYLWIADLSAKDPLYITPIFMGATMFLQQKMTPTAGDPRQAQIMMFMPIIFTAMFLSFPSGLVIYWTVNNLLTIGHQYWLNRTQPATPIVVPEEPKKKGKKRSG